VVRDDRGDATESERRPLRERLEAFAAMVVQRDRALSEAAYTWCITSATAPGSAPRPAPSVAPPPRPSPASSTRTATAAVAPPSRPSSTSCPHGALLALVPVAPALARSAPRGTLLDLLVRRLHPDAERVEPRGRRTAALYATPGGPRRSRCCRARLGDGRGRRGALDLPARGDRSLEIDAFVAEPDPSWLSAFDEGGAASLGGLPKRVRRFSVNWGNVELGRLSRTFSRGADGLFAEDRFLRDFHPARIEACEIERLGPSTWSACPPRGRSSWRWPAPAGPLGRAPRVHRGGRAHRPRARSGDGRAALVPGFERVYLTALHAMREAQAVRARDPKPFWNRLVVFTRPLLTLTRDEIR
jgi:hypothetical protein